jgi:hypothetical protein
MDPLMNAFGEKIAALTPLVRPGLLERSQFKLMRTRAPSAPKAPMPGKFGISTVTKTSVAQCDSITESHEDPLPSTNKGLKKKAMVHPSAQHASETMSPAGWKQTFKDVPLSILAGGLGYGIGKTLAEMIGERAAAGGQRPGWLKAVPLGLAATSAAGAFAASRAREGLKKRREAAE